ncbi:TPA: hypothetical protein N0F65_009170, partial [Lagenidium giganteum]
GDAHSSVLLSDASQPIRLLSNFYPCTFIDEQGQLFHSSEHCFMKRKQELFNPNNDQLSHAILTANTPAVAKKLGRKVRNYDNTQTLLATKDKRLYEAAPRDSIWGIGLGVERVRTLLQNNPEFLRNGDVDDETRARSFGSNLLGEALMEARAWLQSDEDLEREEKHLYM